MRSLLNKFAAPLALVACVAVLFNANAVAQQIQRFFTLQSSTGVEIFPAPAALADDTSNPTLTGLAAYFMCWDGTNWDRCRPATDSTHASAAGTTGPQQMLEATTGLSADTATSDGNATRAKSDINGRLINIVGCNRESRIKGYLANTDGASTALTGMGAPGASLYNEVWAVVVTNASATDGTVDLRDGTAGSVLATFPAPATTDTFGGAVITFPIPITFTANTAVAVDTSGAISTIYVTAVGCVVK